MTIHDGEGVVDGLDDAGLTPYSGVSSGVDVLCSGEEDGEWRLDFLFGPCAGWRRRHTLISEDAGVSRSGVGGCVIGR